MQSKTSFDDLPEVLVMDILSRLPAETLIRSTAVCKVWYSVIKTASFISLHVSRSVSDPSRYYIFLTNDHAYLYGLVKDNHLLTSPSPEHNFFKSKICPKRFVSACKGLVCLRDGIRHGDNIYLVNPFIRKHRELDVKSSCYADLIGEMEDFCGVRIRIDFGYSEIEDDYKVLRIITPDYYQEREMSLKTKPIAEIYSLKTGQWKSLDVSINFKLERFNPATCVLGCLYWYMVQEEQGYLLCFDLKDEVFSKIELPKTYASYFHHKILIKNNSLVIVLYDDPRRNPKYKDLKICLLVLEKNLDGHEVQWRQLSYQCSRSGFSSHDPDFNWFGHELHAFGFSVGGKLIFEVYSDRHDGDDEYYYIDDTRNDYMIAVDLRNKCDIQEFGFSFNKYFHKRNSKIRGVLGATNVLESLVLL